MNPVVRDTEVPLSAPSETALCDPSLQLRLGDVEADHFATVLKALSNPVRLQILDLISQGGGQLCACNIECHFNLTQPTISHHLKVLRDAGLISSEQRGIWVHHRLNTSMLTAIQGLLMLFNNTSR